MRVLLTGAAGFTGRYVSTELERRGDTVGELSADVTDGGAVRREVAAFRPEATIHLAALAFVQSDDFVPFYAVNQVGSFNLLAALADECPGSRVVLASSAQVYGSAAAGLVDETHPVRPANHYALSKLAMELGAAFFADRLQLTIVRPFNYTGRGQEDRYLIQKIVTHFRDRAATIELGNIDVQRDFGDVRAVARAYVGLAHAEVSDLTVNLATGRLAAVRDILAIATAATGHTIDVRINPAFVRANDVPVLGGNPAKCRTILPDWRPFALEDTIRWMLEA